MKVVIPAAGNGSRFLTSKFKSPKPNIIVDGDFMLVAAAKSLQLQAQYIFILREGPFRNNLADSLLKTFPTCKIAVIDFETEGAAETVLIAEDFLDDEELIIANCDQILNWNSELVLKQLRKFDAGLITIESNDIKHSYAKVENNLVIEVQEKNVISDIALTGIHYWKHGKDYITSAKKMFAKNKKSHGEFYVGPVYNEFIADGKRVGHFQLQKKEIHFIGTPEDLEIYENRKTN